MIWWEKAILILAGNLNSSRSCLITAVPLNLTGQNFQNYSDYLMRFLPLCKLGAQIHLRQLHSLSRLLSFDRHFNITQWPKFRVLSKNLELFLLNFEWIKQEKITQYKSFFGLKIVKTRFSLKKFVYVYLNVTKYTF